MLCVDAMEDVALGEAEVGVCESAVELGSVAVLRGTSVVDWMAPCSRTRSTEVLIWLMEAMVDALRRRPRC